MTRVLIIEDEPDMAAGLRDAFEHHGFETICAADGEAGLAAARRDIADVIVLDLMLPKLDGIEVCRCLREQKIDTPIIMLTARGEVADRIAGLETGADDYVTKPFGVGELIARIEAVLRRRGAASGSREPEVADRVEVGATTIDFKRYAAIRDGISHDLTDHEVKLLRLLIAHPHEVINRERLLDEVWGYNAYPTTRTVDTFVWRLRQKIEDTPHEPRHLLTVRGAGYKFVP